MNRYRDNIGVIHNCYGCGVCATVCAHNVISISINKDGFYEPIIEHPNACTNCGLCVDVCSFNKQVLASQNSIVSVYASWSKDDDVRKKSSSGGVAFEIARSLINKGFIACGVRYNPELNRAEHFLAYTYDEYSPSMGSKYIQSYTLDAFKAIKLNNHTLVTGTPCQIDSFRHYLKRFKQEDNFILIDFFCHGVPSKFLWDKYLKNVIKRTGSPRRVMWRNKINGWHDSYKITVEGEKGNYKSRNANLDPFYACFLSDCCLNKACYDNCKYKFTNSSADIRIGDMWGNHYSQEEKGVTIVISFTKRGEEVIKMTNCTLIPSTLGDACESQMKNRPKRALIYEPLRFVLRGHLPLKFIYYFMVWPYRTMKKILNYLRIFLSGI